MSERGEGDCVLSAIAVLADFEYGMGGVDAKRRRPVVRRCTLLTDDSSRRHVSFKAMPYYDGIVLIA